MNFDFETYKLYCQLNNLSQSNFKSLKSFKEFIGA